MRDFIADVYRTEKVMDCGMSVCLTFGLAAMLGCWYSGRWIRITDNFVAKDVIVESCMYPFSQWKLLMVSSAKLGESREYYRIKLIGEFNAVETLQFYLEF